MPWDVSQLRGFLGLASYYRKFIQGFSKVAEPLNRLLRKKVNYRWTNDQQEAFEKLKGCLILASILAYLDFEKLFMVYTDASTIAVGAILSQKDPKSKERVIAYASQSLNVHK